MKTTYLIWKNPLCDGIAPDWEEVTGKEFFALVRSPEGKSRRFIKLPSHDNDGGAIVMEATEADYRSWKREKNHADYLKNCAEGISVVSYHAMESEDGECCGEELLPSGSDFESRSIGSLTHDAALAALSEDEYRLIEYLYLSDKPGTVRGYEELTGISKSTVSRRQKAALEKLKKFLAG